MAVGYPMVSASSAFRYKLCSSVQGSVMGPYLFLLIPNLVLLSVSALTPMIKVISYADDTTILYPINKATVPSDLDSFQEILHAVAGCYSSMGLRLNVDKTQVICFR